MGIECDSYNRRVISQALSLNSHRQTKHLKSTTARINGEHASLVSSRLALLPTLPNIKKEKDFGFHRSYSISFR